jgi:hypothetical protein
MGNRMRRPRFGFAGPRRTQATPMGPVGRRVPGPRASTWLGWLAAAAAVAVVAFIVGRAGPEPGLASPTPSPTPPPLVISFGTALDAASGEATNPTDRFRAGDRIAYSVRLAAPPGVDGILVEIVRLDTPNGTVVQPPSRQGIAAASRIIAFTFTTATSKLLTDWGPGTYEMRISLPGATKPFATGRFTLVETPTAS